MAKIFLLLLFTYVTTTLACSHKTTITSHPTTTSSTANPYMSLSSSTEEDPSQVPNILGGHSATHGDNPHLVSLQDTNQQNMHFCSASIIYPHFLVSAAHCFERHRVPYIRAVAGEYDLKELDRTEQIRDVTLVIIHNKYNDEYQYDNDIALLVLNESLTYDKYVRPITLWNPEWKLPQFGYVSGWGHAPRNPSDKLMSARVRIHDHGNCTAQWSRSARVTNNMLCAGGERDHCPGDSGGALTCSTNLPYGLKQDYLCGIVSWGANCTNPNKYKYPGVYTDVTKYGRWIYEQVITWGPFLPSQKILLSLVLMLYYPL